MINTRHVIQTLHLVDFLQARIYQSRLALKFFASTTETADYLLDAVGLKRAPVLKTGPLQTQQLSDTRRGGLRVIGYAGNSAPDHVDLFHALPDFLGWIKWDR